MKTVALADDLMDRSRLSGAIEGITFARGAGGCAGADLVIVDLTRYASTVTALRAAAPNARIVAFGPHVEDATLAQAADDGADAVFPRSLFFRDPAAAVTEK